MTTSSAIEAELKRAPELMDRFDGLLVGRGYRLVNWHIETSRRTSDSIVFTFENPSSRRKVELSYYPPFDDDKRRIRVSIKDQRGEVFTLLRYLWKHKREEDERKLSIASTDAEEFWRDYFAALRALVEKDPTLAAILDGKQWEDTPIDWQGAK